MQPLTKYTFVDPIKILALAGFQKGQTIADFGSGNGFYPVAAAKLVGDQGTVYAVDVKPESLEATTSAAKHENLKNIYTLHHDLEQPGVPIEENSCDSVILAGIMHLSKVQKNVLRETYRILKSGGSIIVIEWKKEALPFGPNIANRIAEEEMQDLLTQAGLKFNKEIPADTFHYALIFNK